MTKNNSEKSASEWKNGSLKAPSVSERRTG